MKGYLKALEESKKYLDGEKKIIRLDWYRRFR